jgi:hypothetical protein
MDDDTNPALSAGPEIYSVIRIRTSLLPMSDHLSAAGWTGTNVAVKTQQRREEQTVVIATALAVMVGSFALGIMGSVGVGALTDMSHAFNAAPVWVALVAFVDGIGYLFDTTCDPSDTCRDPRARPMSVHSLLVEPTPFLLRLSGAAWRTRASR